MYRPIMLSCSRRNPVCQRCGTRRQQRDSVTQRTVRTHRGTLPYRVLACRILAFSLQLVVYVDSFFADVVM
jgi:hypothetical protein